LRICFGFDLEIILLLQFIAAFFGAFKIYPKFITVMPADVVGQSQTETVTASFFTYFASICFEETQLYLLII
jgi:uncharacterized membrane protein required for colicin V production